MKSSNSSNSRSEWATERAASLLNEAKLLPASKALAKLKEIEELFETTTTLTTTLTTRASKENEDDEDAEDGSKHHHRRRIESDGREKQRAMLRETLRPMLETIVATTDAKVRLYGCEFIERTCTRIAGNMSWVSSSSTKRTVTTEKGKEALLEESGDQFAAALESALMLVTESTYPAVQKRATAASLNAFREVLINAAIEGANVDAIDDDADADETETKKKTKKKKEYSNIALMWKKALDVARAISENVSNETINDGVRMQSAKFCENACLLLAAPDGEHRSLNRRISC